MNKTIQVTRAQAARLAASALAVMAAGANAQSAGATAVTSITAAQADALLVVGALTLMGITVWAAIYIKRKFFP